MILFSDFSKHKILAGEKTQTRRFWLTPRAQAGSFHWAQTTLKPESRFARLRILRIWQWNGTHISDEDAIAEGYKTPNGFIKAYQHLNMKRMKDKRRIHYAVEFEVVNQ